MKFIIQCVCSIAIGMGLLWMQSSDLTWVKPVNETLDRIMRTEYDQEYVKAIYQKTKNICFNKESLIKEVITYLEENELLDSNENKLKRW